MEILKRIWIYLKKLNIEVPKSWIGNESIRDMIHKAALREDYGNIKNNLDTLEKT